MMAHWEKNGPPVYIAVAGYLGLISTDKKEKDPKPSSKPIGNSGEQGNLNDLARMLSGTGGILNG